MLLFMPSVGCDSGANTRSPEKPISVELTKTDGSKILGRYGPRTIQVKTEQFDEVTIDTDKLKSLIFAEDGGTVSVSVTLTDNDTLDGQFLSSSIPVTIQGRAEVYRPGSEIQQVRFLHSKHQTLLGAVLGLITLAVMEIILGVDNIIVLAIVSDKLPQHEQVIARRIGLIAALLTRLGLLFTLTWLLGLTKPLFYLPENPLLTAPESRAISLRDLILAGGGAFLIRKSVKEMHESIEHRQSIAHPQAVRKPSARFWPTIALIAGIDIVFSLDSVITAVGMVDEVWVMVGGMLIAVGVMMIAAEPIARFVAKHPTVKILALSFLILIGVLLVAESLGQHIDKGYIYFAMAFAVAVEMVNMRMRPSNAVES
jgi:predicted tellurium resistance membrane protein TerC